VNHPISERRRADHTRLGIVNLKRLVITGHIAAIFELVLQLPKIFFKLHEESHDLWLLAFAFCSFLSGEIQVFKSDDLWK
jgi:hypothetical protein